MTLRSTAKRALEKVTRRRVITIEPGALAFIDTRVRHADWFSYDLVVQRLLERQRVDLVVDVGANEGQFARRLRRTYAGEIVSFEPIAPAFDRLTRAAAGDSRWSVHQVALGSADRTSVMHVACDTAFSSLLTPNDFSRQRFRQSVVDGEQVVSVRRLDSMLETIVSPGRDARMFLKLDTQGYDLEVFAGLGRFAASVAMMQSEVSLIPIYKGMPHWTESIATYERAGFAVAATFPVNHDAAGRVIEYDCVLVRNG